MKKKKAPQSSIGKYFAEIQQEQHKTVNSEPKKENKHPLDKNKKAKK